MELPSDPVIFAKPVSEMNGHTAGNPSDTFFLVEQLLVRAGEGGQRKLLDMELDCATQEID